MPLHVDTNTHTYIYIYNNDDDDVMTRDDVFCFVNPKDDAP